MLYPAQLLQEPSSYTVWEHKSAQFFRSKSTVERAHSFCWHFRCSHLWFDLQKGNLVPCWTHFSATRWVTKLGKNQHKVCDAMSTPRYTHYFWPFTHTQSFYFTAKGTFWKLWLVWKYSEIQFDVWTWFLPCDRFCSVIAHVWHQSVHRLITGFLSAAAKLASRTFYMSAHKFKITFLIYWGTGNRFWTRTWQTSSCR